MICKCDGSTLVLIKNRHNKSEFIICGNARVMNYNKKGEVLNLKFYVNDLNFHKCNNDKELYQTLGTTFDRKSLLKLINNRINEERGKKIRVQAVKHNFITSNSEG